MGCVPPSIPLQQDATVGVIFWWVEGVLFAAIEKPMAMAEELMVDLVGRTLGEFKFREQIGEGGCAALHRCERPALQRESSRFCMHRGRATVLRRSGSCRRSSSHPGGIISVLFTCTRLAPKKMGRLDRDELLQGRTLGDWASERDQH